MGKKKKKRVLRISDKINSKRFRIERVKSCPIANAQCAIVVEDALLSDLEECVREIRNEFIVYLTGERAHARVVRVGGAYVPEQRVTLATVEADEPFDPARFVAVAHSHHSMGAFHSHTDEDGVDNAPVSIVMSTRGWCAKFAHRLPCGRWGVSTAIAIVSESQSSDAIVRAQQEITIPRAPVPRTHMGDCPDARAGLARAACGIEIRDNALMREILARAREIGPLGPYFTLRVEEGARL